MEQKLENTSRLYLARHGETDFNREGRLQGLLDRPLNETGRAQAAVLAGQVRGLGLVRIGASPLLRARESARICAMALGVPFDYEDADLRERTYGVFEGLTRAELLSHHPEDFRRWQEDNRYTPEGAEAFETVGDRMHRAIGRAMGELAEMKGSLLLVSHGGALRALLHRTTGVFSPPIANCAVFRVTVEEGQALGLAPL